MTRQELDNLIFASGVIHTIQTIEEATIEEPNGITLALQTVYDILAMIIKDNSEEINEIKKGTK